MSFIKVYVVGPDPVPCEEVAAVLRGGEGIASIGHAPGPPSAWTDTRTARADVVAVDDRIEELPAFVRALAGSGARVLVWGSASSDAVLMACLRAGALGLLRTQGVTPQCVAASLRAVASGTGVLAPELLARLLGAGPPRVRPETAGAPLSRRERQVLELIAAGHPTREVAERLCYSERTVKNVLHDVAVKLNARSRCHAVACAVREGLI